MDDRLVVIFSGGDWFDASALHLRVPAGVDLDAERRAHYAWQRALTDRHQYGSFQQWLRDRGATDPAPGDIEEFWDE